MHGGARGTRTTRRKRCVVRVVGRCKSYVLKHLDPALHHDIVIEVWQKSLDSLAQLLHELQPRAMLRAKLIRICGLAISVRASEAWLPGLPLEWLLASLERAELAVKDIAPSTSSRHCGALTHLEQPCLGPLRRLWATLVAAHAVVEGELVVTY